MRPIDHASLTHDRACLVDRIMLMMELNLQLYEACDVLRDGKTRNSRTGK